MKNNNKRIMKVMMPNGGTGNVSPRISLPTVWIKDMGIGKEDRTRMVEMNYSNGIITIKKLDENDNETIE